MLGAKISKYDKVEIVDLIFLTSRLLYGSQPRQDEGTMQDFVSTKMNSQLIVIKASSKSAMTNTFKMETSYIIVFIF